MERYRAYEVGVIGLIGVQSILTHYPTDVSKYIITVLLIGILSVHVWRAALFTGYALCVYNTFLMFGSWNFSYIIVAQAILWGWMAVGAYLFQLPQFPKLSTTYPTVGCTTQRFGENDCRIFYPANATNKQKYGQMPYLHHGYHLAVGLGIFLKVPSFIFSHFKNAWLHALKEAPLLEPRKEGWPVLVFSHGLSGTLEMYASINEQLASEGFVVFVLNHSDGSGSVNRLVDSNMNSTYDYYHVLPPEAAKDWDNVGYKIRNGQLHQRVHQVENIISAVEAVQNDPSSQFYQKLNLNAIGLVGHSYGGATVITAGTRDTRIKTVVAMDPWMEPLDPSVKISGPEVPVLHILSQHWVDWTTHMELLRKHVEAAKNKNAMLYGTKDTRHNNFSDVPLFSPKISQLVKASGKIDASYALKMFADVAANYLKHQLCGTELELTKLESVYPELSNLYKTSSTEGYQTFPSNTV
ncbi:hypothetical protein THRCLA_07400 [Thraustotheca clavata]|uniref:1-alkyl-2-acetylglycerophosphocholine esterase n=1 Tax=Thraustotheca clavata TaxID=74557 RepID=A0A1V9ZDH3_9STRA|nr:hypothetical protein THRCLA_07400 [Thraustotheca clavata]